MNEAAAPGRLAVSYRDLMETMSLVRMAGDRKIGPVEIEAGRALPATEAAQFGGTPAP